MRVAISLTILSFWGLVATTSAQQMPPSLLPPSTNLVPDALIPPPTNLLAHTLAAKDAAAAWEELHAALRPPSPPAEWQTHEPSEKDQADFFTPYVLALMDKLKDFYTRFPNDTNAPDARRQEFEITGVAVRLGLTNQQARLDAEQKALLADPKLPEDDRLSIRQDEIERAAAAKASESETAALAEFEKGIRALQKEFPKRPEIMQMLFEVAFNSEVQKARPLLQEITNSAVASDEAKALAVSQLKKLEPIGKPVDLRFTAVDGREVDLSKMNGKVVLIDFWATWCAPCVEGLPKIKAAYDKLHTNGFEIVGIDSDQEKDILTGFIAENKVPWPQYFDGQGEQNKFAVKFGVEHFPEMWLVDKKGNLRDINARFGLSGKVTKLLAE